MTVMRLSVAEMQMARSTLRSLSATKLECDLMPALAAASRMRLTNSRQGSSRTSNFSRLSRAIMRTSLALMLVTSRPSSSTRATPDTLLAAISSSAARAGAPCFTLSTAGEDAASPVPAPAPATEPVMVPDLRRGRKVEMGFVTSSPSMSMFSASLRSSPLWLMMPTTMLVSGSSTATRCTRSAMRATILPRLVVGWQVQKRSARERLIACDTDPDVSGSNHRASLSIKPPVGVVCSPVRVASTARSRQSTNPRYSGLPTGATTAASAPSPTAVYFW
mmetsp:Transcript_95921/g.266392  ORF Transcript_95921/g.266392 Transcript_95921/m.266392 type:complete len:277 (-) Transcript_95921:324-1154(-)